ncbi:hypothetical protein BIV57_00560 [Mangrovactinospora gilvigrisea]|uniref:Uncharacterized protein n=1 Tax=Mangrovactinospora gilvigrisea TaxID=1428644 RepID=A0A1J7BKZ5_9ACTN|nr:hypothetical protein [Mangrovactinospora gilvigrisea]OIV39371.1 hypothetical protein BIV57_00560 [Mangrovactinospora gilvigrisea]
MTATGTAPRRRIRRLPAAALIVVVLLAGTWLVLHLRAERTAPPLGAHAADVHRLTQKVPPMPTAIVHGIALTYGGASHGAASIGFAPRSDPQDWHWHTVTLHHPATDLGVRVTLLHIWDLPDDRHDAADVRVDPAP